MSRHPRALARIPMATAIGLLLLVGTTPALADDWSIEFDRSVAIGGESWLGPSEVTMRYTPPTWAAVAQDTVRVGSVPARPGYWSGCYISGSNWYGVGGEITRQLGRFSEGRYAVRVDLESNRMWYGSSCSWSSTSKSAGFRVDTTPPSLAALTGPTADAMVTSADAMTWATASDRLAGMGAYDLLLDGVPQAHLASGMCARTCTVRLDPSLLTDGPHTVRVDASDLVDNTTTGDTVPFTVSDVPSVSITGAPAFVISGQSATLHATAAINNASPLTYTWDIDGSGAFAVSTGEVPDLRVTPTVGTTVAVRATAPAGGTATDSVRIDVRRAASGDEPGVSINDGDRFTNDPTVRLDIVWPDGATTMRIATDGGFRGATAVPVAATAEVTLPAEDASRLSNTVYLRFSGPGVKASETYTDDIILDTTAPVVTSATARVVVGATATARAVRGRAPRMVRVRTQAMDARSGVRSLQVVAPRGASGRTVAFAPSLTTPFAGRVMWLRALDAAGNASSWRRLTVRGARPALRARR